MQDACEKGMMVVVTDKLGVCTFILKHSYKNALDAVKNATREKHTVAAKLFRAVTQT